MYYFSYGSNMSSLRLLARVPTARFVTTATLPNHELKYHKHSQVDGSGKCDIFFTGNSQHIVQGIVFEIEDKGKNVLDAFEGLGIGYDDKMVALHSANGSEIEAVTYYATIINSAVKPYQWYKEHVMRGAMEFGLPEDYIANYIDVEAVEDSDVERHARELEIYKTR